MTSTQILRSIEERLETLRGQITTLTDAREALANGATRTPVPRTRATTTTRPARRRERSKPTEALPAAKVEQILVPSSEGLTTRAIATQANAKPDQVLALLRELEAAGKARRSGQRRGTRWHAITDEDRIATRAAELEKRSKRYAAASHKNSPNAMAKLS